MTLTRYLDLTKAIFEFLYLDIFTSYLKFNEKEKPQILQLIKLNFIISLSPMISFRLQKHATKNMFEKTSLKNKILKYICKMF